jgi:hypothetical protein
MKTKTLALILLTLAGAAAAGESSRERTVLLPAYRQECGSCHVPYSPRLLPAESWHRVMRDLSRHYGTDASLDAASSAPISRWLLENAGTGKRAREAPAQDRITRARWFLREHDEVSAATWKLPAVKSAANCAACHTAADEGDFSERRIRVPR